MKKIYLTAGFVLASACLFAQPQLTQANVPMNLSATFYYAEVQNFNPGSAGANQTWDFSDIEVAEIGQSTVSPASGTPYANSYPQANHAILYDGLGASIWLYNTVNAQKIEQVALVYTGVVALPYLNPKTIVQFPYTVNSTFTDTYRDSPDPQDDVSFTATYDGYGTLILPFGTFSNVIRQKIVEEGKTEYNWFNSNPFYPIMQTSLEDGSIGLMKNNSLGLGDNPRNGFSVYPNPFADVISVQIPSNVSGKLDFRVSDLVGKTVHKTQIDNAISGSSATIDLSFCARGVYVLEITDSNKNISTKK